jgi:hypothetical protein
LASADPIRRSDAISDGSDLRIVYCRFLFADPSFKEQQIMIVKMQKKGRSITGLRIGSSNVRRFFPSGVQAIDLELDHLRIQCDLNANFWLDRPEISDPRLCSWLQDKFFCEKLPGKPVSIELVQAGNSYRLNLLRSPREAKI